MLFYRAFRITCQRVYLSGEDNSTRGIRRETNKPAIYEGHGMKIPIITWVLPETGRSNPG